jgi:hypothetical protein
MQKTMEFCSTIHSCSRFSLLGDISFDKKICDTDVWGLAYTCIDYE